MDWSDIVGIAGFVLAFLTALKPIWNKWCQPDLEILHGNLGHHSLPYAPFRTPERHFALIRIPIRNRKGDDWFFREAAKNVEVHLESVKRRGGEFPEPKFLPIRLKWAHLDSPRCDWIAEGSSRLLDFATLAPNTREHPTLRDTSISGVAAISGECPSSLRFCTEVEAMEIVPFPQGEYDIVLTVTCKQYCQKHHLTLRWNNAVLLPDPDFRRSFWLGPRID